MEAHFLNEPDTLKKKVSLYATQGRWSKIGAIGERIFFNTYSSLGFKISSFHNNGADYIVNGVQRLDVKTRTLLTSDDVSRISIVPRKQRIKETTYAYVVYFRSNIRVYVEDALHKLQEIRSMSWEDADRLLDQRPIKKKESNTESNRIQIKTAKLDLSKWVLTHTKHQPKIIYRSNKLAQDSMEQRGWGADNFEQREFSEANPQALIILMFFDSCEIYKLYAYPTSEIERIDWQRKPVGPNLNTSSGFDPRSLSDRYKFIDEADFKKNVIHRFGLMSANSL